jgi:serine carboxypeptidase-like clade 1
VGNAVTDPWIDGAAYPPFAVGKSLISTDLYNSIQKACGPDSSLPVFGFGPGSAAQLARHSKPDGKECDNLLQKMQDELSELNLYNVLEDCHYKPRPSPSLAAVRKLQAAARRGRPLFANAAAARKAWKQWPVRGGVPQGSKVYNWAHLLHLDPPCTTAT